MQQAIPRRWKSLFADASSRYAPTLVRTTTTRFTLNTIHFGSRNSDLRQWLADQ